MAEILGIGCTHGPHLQFLDETMANILRRHLERETTPPEQKDMRNWPPAMREEWGDDEGLSSAKKHRAVLVEGFRKARKALDEFKPDLVLIWGDDQYENFHEDLVPPFAIYAMDCFETMPFKPSAVMGKPDNVWGQPFDKVVPVPGHPEAATMLAGKLVKSGFDVACSFAFHHAENANHAFVRTILYLDYDQKGFDYPIIPFHVNCYGSDLFRNARHNVPFQAPPSPPPWRCYDLGRTIAKILEESPYRVAVIGSSSWSHAFLTRKSAFLHPDVEADRQRFEEIRQGKLKQWRDLKLEDIQNSGQHEILNWVCLAGAMEGRQAEVLAYSETYIFNSSKAVVLFPV